MDEQSTDILIIGAGLSGMHLLNAIQQNKALRNKKILMLDDNSMQEKTWSFWEKGNGQWDNIAHKIWSKGVFIDNKGKLSLEMKGYQYKMVRSTDFIAHFKEKIATDPRVELKNEKVEKVDIEKNTAFSSRSQYSATYIFDSRFDPSELKSTNLPGVLQHFKGHFIQTDQDVFDPEEFTMMDFIPAKDDQCTFIYVLPFSKREALIEYTYFTPNLVPEEEYDRLIGSYIKERFKSIKVEILDSEFGIIPMSSYDFAKYNTEKYCRIGTAGGWVKASSGYSFKHGEKKSKLIAENLAKERRPDHGLTNARFRMYDRIFLSILQNENELGNRIFQEMYRKNRTDHIFRFLDEDSNPFEELRIVTSFNPKPFLRAVSREFF